jgi:hypothetical protein
MVVGQFRDLAGQIFGRWTVLYLARMDNPGGAVWHCICSCVNKTEKDILGGRLTTGGTKSCGCDKSRLISEAFRDNLIGMIFGGLTVVGFSGTKKGKSIWHCVCDCGNEIDVIGNSLKTGNTASCGCLLRWMAKKLIIQRSTTHGLSGTPEYHRASVRKRKEKKKLLDSQWTSSMEIEIFKFFEDDGCAICGTIDDLTVDHVYPLSKGYGLKPGNAVILCRSHNSYKRTKNVEDLPIGECHAILLAAERFLNYWNSIMIAGDHW